VKFHYSRQCLHPSERFLERLLEILPGLTSWGILLGLVILSFAKPVTAAVVIIVFDFYWLLRLFYLTIFLALSYVRLSVESATDWMQRIVEIDQYFSKKRKPPASSGDWKQKASTWVYERELKTLEQSGTRPPLSSAIYHLVIVTVVKEGEKVLTSGIQSFMQGTFPSKRTLLVYAVEERTPAEIKKQVYDLCEFHRPHFLDVLVSEHPDGQPGEARVKGANATHAAIFARRFLEKKDIPVENVIVSCFDADTVVSPQYFACLTYSFLVCPHRQRASYQPIPVYHNNIWDVPGFARILEMGSSFFQLTEATKPDKMVTFSSHSMSFKALVEIGYWPVDMVSDDSAIFWKALLYYEGDYRVVPLYATVSMDVVAAENWWMTCVNVYKQKRRWAWGIENFPILMRGFIQCPRISFMQKFQHTIKIFEAFIAWATWPVILAVIGWLPAVFASREFSHCVLYYTAPRIAGTIFNLATVSLVTTIVLSLCLLPKKKIRYSFLKRVLHALEWLLIPIVAIFFSALPALDAQTRLMLGRYMEFWVTDKTRKHEIPEHAGEHP
jgi:hypothetical protein